MYKVGDKVVCIVDPALWANKNERDLPFPQQGETYTVAYTRMGKGKQFIALAELPFFTISDDGESVPEAWDAVAFRRLSNILVVQKLKEQVSRPPSAEMIREIKRDGHV